MMEGWLGSLDQMSRFALHQIGLLLAAAYVDVWAR
jgi:hypothetical protein